MLLAPECDNAFTVDVTPDVALGFAASLLRRRRTRQLIPLTTRRYRTPVITVTTDHGSYTGETIVSVIHAAYGINAQPMRSPDPDSEHFGVVVINEQFGTEIVATILRVEQH